MISRYAIPGLVLMLALMTSVAGADTNLPQRWSHAIDSRNTGQWLSIRHGVVYAVQDQHVVAIELGSGRQRWRSSIVAQSRPVDLTGLGRRETRPTSCRFVEGARIVGRSLLVHCDDSGMRSHLYAFDLRDSPGH